MIGIILAYEIICGSILQVEETVNERIEEGWQPYGTPFQKETSGSYEVAQAMVKYDYCIPGLRY